MIDVLPATLNVVASLGFAAAIWFAAKNHRITSGFSEVWFLYAVGMVFAAVFAAANVLEHLGIMPAMFDSLENSMFSALAVLLFAFAIMMRKEYVTPSA